MDVDGLLAGGGNEKKNVGNGYLQRLDCLYGAFLFLVRNYRFVNWRQPKSNFIQMKLRFYPLGAGFSSDVLRVAAIIAVVGINVADE